LLNLGATADASRGGVPNPAILGLHGMFPIRGVPTGSHRSYEWPFLVHSDATNLAAVHAVDYYCQTLLQDAPGFCGVGPRRETAVGGLRLGRHQLDDRMHLEGEGRRWI
jgi:hypothetical protein